MSPFFLTRFTKASADGAYDILVAYLATSNFEEEEFLDVVSREIDANLRPDELIVLVRTTTFADAKSAFESSVTTQNLLDRLGSRTHVSIIGFGENARETQREKFGEGQSAIEISLAEIGRRGATAIFRKRGGFLESTSNYHFENPSKRHTDRFIRLSNILVKYSEISFLAFTLLPFIESHSEFAYIDTPSLFAVVASINDHLRAINPDRLPLVAENFGSYPNLKSATFTAVDKAVVIISASSSGGLANRLSNSFSKERIVHLLYHGNKPYSYPIAVDISSDKTANPDGYDHDRSVYEPGKCLLCEQGSKAIRLKGDQFDIEGPQPTPLVISKDDAPTHTRVLMERLVGSKALSVGMANQGKARRQFLIDPARLLSRSPKYLQRLQYACNRHIPAGVSHAIAIDDESEKLIEIISKTIDRSIEILPQTKIDQLKDSFEPNSGKAILVVAAVIESGRSLLDVSRDLRNICPLNPIVYIAGFAKMASEQAEKTLRANLIQTNNSISHSFVVVDSLIVPPAGGANAWVDELNLWNTPGILNQFKPDDQQLIKDRIERLNKTSEPLIDDLFLGNKISRLLPVQKGFVFWPKKLPENTDKTEADVFFTVATVLQKLRSSVSPNARSIRTNLFQQTLLAPENFGRFNDGIIQASLLRAARPAELDYTDDPGTSADASRIIGRVIDSAHLPRGEAAMEFLIAIACRRLRLWSSDLNNVLSDRPFCSPLLRNMIDICRSI